MGDSTEVSSLPVATTVRLTEAETEALRAQAEIEGCSVQDVFRRALRDYIDQYGHRARVAASTADVVERYGEALRRLGE